MPPTDIRRGQVTGRGSKRIAQPRAVDEEVQSQFLACQVNITQLRAVVDRAQLGGHGDVDHCGLRDMLIVIQHCRRHADLARADAPVAALEGDALMPRAFHRARFVDVDMPRVSAEDGFIRAKRRGNHGHVCLRAADEEMHVRIRAGKRLAHGVSGFGAVGVRAVAGVLFEVHFIQAQENRRVAALGVIVVQANHHGLPFLTHSHPL